MSATPATVDARGVAVQPEVLPAAQSETAAVLSMIERLAKDPSVDIDRVERMMVLHREMRAEKAREAFNTAMAAVQAELPQIKRDAENNHTRSSYARLETIAAKVDPVINRHGMSLSYGIEKLDGELFVFCDVALGSHEKRVHMPTPLDRGGSQGKNNKTEIQALGSSISYARRYLKLMIFDIALTNEDNDGNRVGVEDDRLAPRQEQRRDAPKAEVIRHDRPVITEAQALDLRDLLREKRASEADFLAWLKLARIDDIPADIYAECVTAIRNLGRN